MVVMKRPRPRPPRRVAGIHAPAPRLTFTGALLLALALSTSFVVAMAGFATALSVAWPY